MNITELMNYRFLNPDKEIEVDTKITEAYVSRNRDNVDFFRTWADASKESEKILPVIDSYTQEINYSKEEGYAKAA